MSTGILQKVDKNGKKNRGIVKRYTRIRERREKCRKKESNVRRRKGTSSFTMDGRQAEITVDLVLQARATMSDKKVNGPEDGVVSEMASF